MYQSCVVRFSHALWTRLSRRAVDTPSLTALASVTPYSQTDTALFSRRAALGPYGQPQGLPLHNHLILDRQFHVFSLCVSVANLLRANLTVRANLTGRNVARAVCLTLCSTGKTFEPAGRSCLWRGKNPALSFGEPGRSVINDT